MTPADVLDVFSACFDAQRAAVAPLVGAARRARTDVPGQYALDLAADAVIVPLLLDAGFGVVSEESGRSGAADAPITVVVDPVDGSTNCSREIPYWAISLCALDGDGPLAALVANGATGERFTAVRGAGAQVDGRPLAPSPVTRLEDSLIVVTGWPHRHLPVKQFRVLGSAALTLCDVAAGRIDGYLDVVPDMHAPWDYLGGALVCTEAGAPVRDANGLPLSTPDPAARRTMVAAGTTQLAAILETEARA
jgi:myo-inositol-1(or 4)-monophosphatase